MWCRDGVVLPRYRTGTVLVWYCAANFFGRAVWLSCVDNTAPVWYRSGVDMALERSNIGSSDVWLRPLHRTFDGADLGSWVFAEES